jgi:flagellar hook-associated protein 3 FlgL
VGRQLKTSAVNVFDPAQVETGQGYKVTITNMTLGATAATGIATYTVEGLAPNAFAPVTLTSAAFDSKIPVSIPITIPNSVSGNPALDLKITGDVRIGDSVTVEPVTSIFKTLENAIDGIEGATTGNEAAQAVAQALTNIDIGLSKLSSVRGQAGDLLNRADRITTNQDKRSIQLEDDRSRAEDLDMTKGISDFQNQQTGYQAALQSYAQVQKLSLFNFIG